MKTEINVNQTPVAVQPSNDAHNVTDYTTNHDLPGTAVQQALKSAGSQTKALNSNQAEPAQASHVAKAALKESENESKKAEESSATADEVNEALSRVQNNLGAQQRDFEFAVDDASGTMVVTITDRSTKEVLRQIPSEEFLVMAKNIEQNKGNFFEGEA